MFVNVHTHISEILQLANKVHSIVMSCNKNGLTYNYMNKFFKNLLGY